MALHSSSPPPAGAGEDNLPAARPPDDDRPGWPLWIAPAGVVLGFGLATFGTIIVDVIAGAQGGSVSNPDPAANIISDIVFDLCFVAAALWLPGRHRRLRAALFGHRPNRPVDRIVAVVVGAIAFYAVTAIYAAIV